MDYTSVAYSESPFSDTVENIHIEPTEGLELSTCVNHTNALMFLVTTSAPPPPPYSPPPSLPPPRHPPSPGSPPVSDRRQLQVLQPPSPSPSLPAGEYDVSEFAKAHADSLVLNYNGFNLKNPPWSNPPAKNYTALVQITLPNEKTSCISSSRSLDVSDMTISVYASYVDDLSTIVFTYDQFSFSDYGIMNATCQQSKYYKCCNKVILSGVWPKLNPDTTPDFVSAARVLNAVNFMSTTYEPEKFKTNALKLFATDNPDQENGYNFVDMAHNYPTLPQQIPFISPSHYNYDFPPPGQSWTAWQIFSTVKLIPYNPMDVPQFAGLKMLSNGTWGILHTPDGVAEALEDSPTFCNMVDRTKSVNLKASGNPIYNIVVSSFASSTWDQYPFQSLIKPNANNGAWDDGF